MARRGPRSSAGDVAEYDDGPSRNRWDRERFDFYTRTGGRGGGGGERELDIRINERRGSPPSHHHSPAPAPAPPPPAPRRSVVEERERFYERDTYSPPRRRDVYWEEPTPSEVARTALAPYRKKEFIREYDVPARPARPGLLRRQSSLDTFDRRPLRYDHEEWRPPAYVPVPLPVRRRDYLDDYEEVRWRERERNRDLSPGWEEEYRDVRVRRRGKSRRRHRSHSVRSASTSSSSSSEGVKSSKTSKSSKTVVEVRPPLIGKKGKTRMPKRLVHKQAIMDMSLPFEEEEHFIIVQRALEKEQIDEVIKKSEGYKDTKVTYKYEEVKETVKEDDKKTEIVIPPPPPVTMIPPPPPPGSVHGSVHESHHHHHDHSPSRTIIEEKFVEKIEERSPLPPITTLERIERIDRRSDRSIRDEIRALEAEREALRLERKADRRLLEAERYRDGEYEYELVERRRPVVEEVVRVEKDRKGRLALVKSNH